MKKILFFIFAALAFVACEKYDDELGDLYELGSSGLLEDNSGYVKLSKIGCSLFVFMLLSYDRNHYSSIK